MKKINLKSHLDIAADHYIRGNINLFVWCLFKMNRFMYSPIVSRFG